MRPPRPKNFDTSSDMYGMYGFKQNQVTLQEAFNFNTHRFIY